MRFPHDAPPSRPARRQRPLRPRLAQHPGQSDRPPSCRLVSTMPGTIARIAFDRPAPAARVKGDLRWNGALQRIITGLGNSANKGTGMNATGPHAVEFIGGDLYLVTGLGGNPDIRK